MRMFIYKKLINQKDCLYYLYIMNKLLIILIFTLIFYKGGYFLFKKCGDSFGNTEEEEEELTEIMPEKQVLMYQIMFLIMTKQVYVKHGTAQAINQLMPTRS